TAPIADTWVVRSNAYQMRVAPVPENPEMVIIRPNPPDFIFPAGRYALVLKDTGYDFTIDGPTTDAAHCLERTDALASPIYNECRTRERYASRHSGRAAAAGFRSGYCRGATYALHRSDTPAGCRACRRLRRDRSTCFWQRVRDSRRGGSGG